MDKNHKQYLATLAVSVISVLLLCMFINILMDPLWYFHGNRLSKTNFTFNERVSKTNQFLKRTREIDCIILGSSRTTILNENLIENYDCFNYSFSGGRIEEMNAFALYVIDKGISPKLVIAGVDDFNFIDDNSPSNIPDFIINRSSPPTFVQSYLSLDALEFSFRLLRNKSPLPRYYDDDFVVNIIDTTPEYNPSLYLKNADLLTRRDKDLLSFLESEPLESLNYRLAAVRKYQELRTLFEGSEFIGYVPPVSFWTITSKSRQHLSGYLDSLYRISRFIKPFYDFSIPSDITFDTSNTYDGSHYNLKINRLIADRINNESQIFGVRVDTMTREEYFGIFQRALNKYRGIYNKSG